jgi:hypothetical protein
MRCAAATGLIRTRTSLRRGVPRQFGVSHGLRIKCRPVRKEVFLSLPRSEFTSSRLFNDSTHFVLYSVRTDTAGKHRPFDFPTSTYA